MKKADYQLIAAIATVLAVIFWIAAIWTHYYREMIGEFRYPLQQYTPNYVMVGIVFLVIGIAFFLRAIQEK